MLAYKVMVRETNRKARAAHVGLTEDQLQAALGQGFRVLRGTALALTEPAAASRMMTAMEATLAWQKQQGDAAWRMRAKACRTRASMGPHLLMEAARRAGRAAEPLYEALKRSLAIMEAVGPLGCACNWLTVGG